MMTSLIISSLAGLVLGQRFKVLILLPAICTAVVAATGAGVARGDSRWSIVLLAISVAVALQIGYLVGTGIRSLLAAGRATRHYPGSVAAPAVGRRIAH
jgi:hypothetical protein